MRGRDVRPLRATFVGIGAQKSASTWLYGVLKQSAAVRVSDDKEVDFFSYYFDRGYEWYERNFDGSQDRVHRGEISPSYLVHPSAAKRAAEYNPDLQIFVTLRDPVSRAFSNHLHEVRKGHISDGNLEFETALDNNPFYREQGLYAQHLAKWYDHFPKENIHVIFQEEINKDRIGAARQVTDALDLPPLEEFLDLRANESVQYKNPILGEALWKVGNFARNSGMGKVVEAAKTLPGVRQMRQANREALRDVIAPMRDETAEALIDFYKDDVDRLQKMLGVTVPWGRFIDPV